MRTRGEGGWRNVRSEGVMQLDAEILCTTLAGRKVGGLPWNSNSWCISSV